MNASEAVWVHKSGRNPSDGDRFSIDNLVHASGRILSKVWCPTGDEYAHRVCFYCTIPKAVLADQNEAFDFIDVDSARAFALNVLSQFNPFAPPLVSTAAPSGDNSSECHTPTTKPPDAGKTQTVESSELDTPDTAPE